MYRFHCISLKKKISISNRNVSKFDKIEIWFSVCFRDIRILFCTGYIKRTVLYTLIILIAFASQIIKSLCQKKKKKKKVSDYINCCQGSRPLTVKTWE